MTQTWDADAYERRAEFERQFQAELDWQRGMAAALREEERIRAGIAHDEAQREQQRIPDFIGPRPTPNR